MALDHVRSDRFRGTPHSGEVHVKGVLPLLVSDLPELTQRPDARIRYQNIDVAELFDTLSDRIVHLCLRTNISRDCKHSAAELFHLTGSLGEIILTPHRIVHRSDLIG